MGDHVDDGWRGGYPLVYYLSDGAVDYWTAPVPFTFGSPVGIGASIAANFFILQYPVDGFAALRLMGIEVTNDQGQIVAAACSTESGAD